MRYLTTLLLLLLALPLTACGGSSLGDAIRESLHQTVPARVESLSGSISNTGAVQTDFFLHVGDDAADRMWRGFLAYDLPEPRAGYVLEAATLYLAPDRFDGDGFRRLGGIFLQRVDLGATLDASDYSRGGDSWTLAIDAETMDMLEIDIRELVQRTYDEGDRRFGLRFRTAVSTVFRDGRVDAATLGVPMVLLNWRRL